MQSLTIAFLIMPTSSTSPSAISPGAFESKVAALVAKGWKRHDAWVWCKEHHQKEYAAMSSRSAANEAPAGTTVSHDGRTITSEWPVPGSVLAALDLPLSAERNDYEAARLAKATALAVPTACRAVEVIVQYQQLEHGMQFSNAWSSAEQHCKDLFALIRRDLHSALPAGVEGRFPAPDRTLLRMGLPLDCTSEQFSIYSMADRLTVKPADAAIIIVQLVAFGRHGAGIGWPKARAFLLKFDTEITAALAQLPQ